jgi:hypothetical protein
LLIRAAHGAYSRSRRRYTAYSAPLRARLGHQNNHLQSSGRGLQSKPLLPSGMSCRNHRVPVPTSAALSA